MNLRHIDPRSTDWMDAMLERDDEQPEGRRRRTPAAGIAVEAAAAHELPSPAILSAAAAPPQHTLRGPSR